MGDDAPLPVRLWAWRRGQASAVAAASECHLAPSGAVLALVSDSGALSLLPVASDADPVALPVPTRLLEWVPAGEPVRDGRAVAADMCVVAGPRGLSVHRVDSMSDPVAVQTRELQQLGTPSGAVCAVSAAEVAHIACDGSGFVVVDASGAVACCELRGEWSAVAVTSAFAFPLVPLAVRLRGTSIFSLELDGSVGVHDRAGSLLAWISAAEAVPGGGLAPTAFDVSADGATLALLCDGIVCVADVLRWRRSGQRQSDVALEHAAPIGQSLIDRAWSRDVARASRRAHPGAAAGQQQPRVLRLGPGAVSGMEFAGPFVAVRLRDASQHGRLVLWDARAPGDERAPGVAVLAFDEPWLPAPCAGVAAPLFLSASGISALVPGITQGGAIDAVVAFCGTPAAEALCAINGWDRRALQMHSLATGLRFRRADAVVAALRGLDPDQHDLALRMLAASAAEEGGGATGRAPSDFAGQLAGVAMSFASDTLARASRAALLWPENPDHRARLTALAGHVIALRSALAGTRAPQAPLANSASGSPVGQTPSVGCSADAEPLAKRLSRIAAAGLGIGTGHSHASDRTESQARVVSSDAMALAHKRWEGLDASEIARSAALEGALALGQAYIRAREGGSAAVSTMGAVAREVGAMVHRLLRGRQMDAAIAVLRNAGLDHGAVLRAVCMSTISRDMRAHASSSPALRSRLGPDDTSALAFLQRLETSHPPGSVAGALAAAGKRLVRCELRSSRPNTGAPDAVQRLFDEPADIASVLPDTPEDAGDPSAPDTPRSAQYFEAVGRWACAWDDEARQRIVLEQAAEVLRAPGSECDAVAGTRAWWAFHAPRADLRSLAERTRQGDVAALLADVNATVLPPFVRKELCARLVVGGVLSPSEASVRCGEPAALVRFACLALPVNGHDESAARAIATVAARTRERDLPLALEACVSLLALDAVEAVRTLVGTRGGAHAWLELLSAVSVIDVSADRTSVTSACAECTAFVSPAFAAARASGDMRAYLDWQESERPLLSVALVAVGAGDRPTLPDAVARSHPFLAAALSQRDRAPRARADGSLLHILHAVGSQFSEQFDPTRAPSSAAGHSDTCLTPLDFVAMGRPSRAYEAHLGGGGSVGAGGVTDRADVAVRRTSVLCWARAAVVASCASFFELASWDGSALRVDAAAVARIARTEGAGAAESFAVAVAAALRGETAIDSATIARLETATRAMVAGSGLPSASWDAARLWRLPYLCARAHGDAGTPLRFMELCAAHEDWLLLLAFAQSLRIPADAVVNASAHARNADWCEHIRVFIDSLSVRSPGALADPRRVLMMASDDRSRGLRATFYSKVGLGSPRRASASLSPGDASAAPEAEALSASIYTAPLEPAPHAPHLFALVAASLKAPGAARVLLRQALIHARPLLAVLAACVEGVTALEAACAFVVAACPALMACAAGVASTTGGASLAMLEALGAALVRRGNLRPLQDALALFDPSHPLVDFVRFGERFVKRDFAAARAHLAAFVAAAAHAHATNANPVLRIGDVDWSLAAARELAATLLDRCPTRHERMVLVEMLCSSGFDPAYRQLRAVLPALEDAGLPPRLGLAADARGSLGGGGDGDGLSHEDIALRRLARCVELFAASRLWQSERARVAFWNWCADVMDGAVRPSRACDFFVVQVERARPGPASLERVALLRLAAARSEGPDAAGNARLSGRLWLAALAAGVSTPLPSAMPAANLGEAATDDERNAVRVVVGSMLRAGDQPAAETVARQFGCSDLPEIIASRVALRVASSGSLADALADETLFAALQGLGVDLSAGFDSLGAVLRVLAKVVPTTAVTFVHRVSCLVDAAAALGVDFESVVQMGHSACVSTFLGMSDSFAVCRAYVAGCDVPAPVVADAVVEAYLRALRLSRLRRDGDDEHEGQGAVSPAWSQADFLRFATVCPDVALVGRRLLDAASQPSAGWDVPGEANLVIRAHQCFSLACSEDGMAAVVAHVRARVDAFATAGEYRTLAKIAMEIRRFRETECILDALLGHDQLELVLRKAMDKNGVPEFRAALHDYLRRRHPKDTTRLTMVFAHFSMLREIGDMLSEEATKRLHAIRKPMSTASMGSELVSIMRLLTDAAESYVRDDAARRANKCVALARLIGLQLQVGDSLCVLNLSTAEATTVMAQLPRFFDALIVSEAYGVSDWVGSVFQQAVVLGNVRFAEDYLLAMPARDAFFVELVGRFKGSLQKVQQMAPMRRIVSLVPDVRLRYRLARDLSLDDVVASLLASQSGLILKDLEGVTKDWGPQ